VYGNAKRNREAKAYAEAVGADWIGLGIPESGKGVKSDPPAFSSGAFDIIEKLSNRWNFISYYLPLAFAHPEHNRVRDSFEKKLGGLVSLFYYIDTPYQLTQKYGTALQHELGGMKIESYLTPPSRKWKHVPLFKSQQLFFHYNPPEKLRNCPEVIVYERGTWL
jgi:hypothetical protein